MSALPVSKPFREAFCIRCLCTESKACAGGCSWSYFNDRHRIGICSSCTTRGDSTVEAKRRETREKMKSEVDRFIKSARDTFATPDPPR